MATKKIKPINVTADGCAFTIRARYGQASTDIKGLTGGAGTILARE